MAVSNFQGTDPIVAFAPIAANLQQNNQFEGIRHFEGQELIAHDVRGAKERAQIFIRLLGQTLSPSKESKPALGMLLNRILYLSDAEKDKQRSGVISQAFFKQRGYFLRLFSDESWEEWTENRTALGKVVSHLGDCMESHAQVSSFTERLDAGTVRKANNEAGALLKKLDHRDTATVRSFSSEISCTTGLVGGTFGSLLTQHPLPLLLGLSQCFPRVSAQQKVGSEFQVNNHTTSDQEVPSVASFANGNFVVTWDSWGEGGGPGVYGQLFERNGSKIGSEFHVNTNTQADQVMPSVSSLNNENFVVIWESSHLSANSFLPYGQIFNRTGTKIGSEFRVNLNIGSSWRQKHSVVSLKNGNFVVAWPSRGGGSGSYEIYCQIFNITGARIGSEFQANTITTNDQMAPSVVNLQDGNFVVTWNSQGQDGSGFGIYGQIFHDNLTLSSKTSTTSVQTTTTISRSATSNPFSSSSPTKSIADIRSKLTFTSPSRNNRFWLGFLLGASGWAGCLALVGYLLHKSRRREESGDTIELREKGSLGGAPPLEFGGMEGAASTEEHYQRTPDHVHPL